MRAALWVVMLVACNDVHGVAVLVHPNNPDVRFVRLFMGAGSSTTADLTPDSGVTAGSAAYWVRDQSNDCDTCDVVPVGTGNVVKFSFETSDAIPVVIAVGYDAQKQPIVAGLAHDLAPSDHSNDFFGYELDLAPASPFSATSTTSLQLDLWSPPNAAKDPFAAQCAGIIDANADHPYFVVRAEDQDCDGLVDTDSKECTPDYYLGTAPADPADATCLFRETTRCRLGGMGCIDGGGIAPACSPSETCVPTNLCGQCMDKYACAAEILSSGMVNPLVTAHYACTVVVDAGGMACTTPLVLDRPPTGGYDCTGIQIADANTQLTDKIDQGNVTITAAEHVDSATSCQGTLAFQGHPMSSSTSLSAMVAFTLKNNAGIALPVTIQFQPGACPSQPMPCTLDAHAFDDATLTSCATAWTGPSVAVELPSTGSPDASDPSLTQDLKQMFYESGNVVYQAIRSNNMWTMGLPVSATGNGADHAPELAGTGLSLVTTSTNGASVTSLYVATRADLNSAFGTPTPITNLDPMLVFSAATFAPDDMGGNHHMIAAGVLSGSTFSALYDLTLDPTMHTITKEAAIMLNVVDVDRPHLTADGLHLYFDGVSLPGTRSIYVASRSTIADSFRSAVRLVELDDAQDVANQTTGAWVSAGAHTMFYTHTMGGTKKIYQTSRVTF